MIFIGKGVSIKIPEIKDFIDLNESLASTCGTYGAPKVIGIALNTSKLSKSDSLNYIINLEKQTGLPVTDVIRFGVKKIVNQLSLKGNPLLKKLPTYIGKKVLIKTYNEIFLTFKNEI